jgi:hypothetical protein
MTVEHSLEKLRRLRQQLNAADPVPPPISSTYGPLWSAYRTKARTPLRRPGSELSAPPAPPQQGAEGDAPPPQPEAEPPTPGWPPPYTPPPDPIPPREPMAHELFRASIISPRGSRDEARADITFRDYKYPLWRG